MNTKKFPEDKAKVAFTDMQGIRRKGSYSADLHGFQEDIDLEMPDDPQFVYPEDDITSWENI